MEWTEWGGTIADWLGVVLTAVAIVIGIWVAKKVDDRSVEIEARERYQSLVDLGVEVLDHCRSVTALTNSRWSDLLGRDLTTASRQSDQARTDAIAALDAIETRVEMLIMSAHLLPSRSGARAATSVAELQRQGAWLLGALTHAVVHHFSSDSERDGAGSVERPASRADQLESMVEVDIQNVPWDLLFVAEGLKVEDANVHWHEKGSHWPRLHKRRVDELLHQDAHREAVDPGRAPHLGAEEGIDLFRRALVGVVDSYEAARRS